MSNVWIPNKQVFCPLCDKPFEIKRFRFPNRQIVPSYICRSCNVFTFKFDPLFNKWRDTDKEVPCPVCKTSMKWFGRMTDNFIKAQCPECGVGFTKDSDMAISKSGAVETEDMFEPQPEPTQIKIPIDKLPTSEENKKAIKERIKRKKEQ